MLLQEIYSGWTNYATPFETKLWRESIALKFTTVSCYVLYLWIYIQKFITKFWYN